MNNKKQRNRLFTMLMLVMALLIPQWGWAQTASPPAEGNGSTDHPYIITKAAELAWFRDQVNGGNNEICAKIADNVEVIDLKDFCHAADASQNLEELSWVPIGNIKGITKVLSTEMERPSPTFISMQAKHLWGFSVIPTKAQSRT